MDFIFCSHPRRIHEADPDFANEAGFVDDLGANIDFLDHDALLAGDIARSLRGIDCSENQRVVCYRGWMMPPSVYKQLYNELLKKSLVLVNRPDQFQYCHYLPESYSSIKDKTPETVWLPGQAPFDIKVIKTSIQPFNGRPLILKDYVKSQKHYWAEACYIPDSHDHDAVMNTVNRFVELQGGEVEGGLVFREYVPIKIIGKHPISGMPLSHEYRVVWFDQEPIAVWPYWDASDTRHPDPPVHEFASFAKRINSRFFTMDIAELEDGSWVIVELGDAQVAGLPDNATPETYYRALTQGS